MDEFAFYGLSGGEAMVLHIEQGHVFRFKIERFAIGTRAILARRERGQHATDEPELHLQAATAFAERSFAALRDAEASSLPRPEQHVSLWRKVMSRRPAKPMGPTPSPDGATPSDTLHS